MKLMRFGEKGKERPGIWMDDGRILDVRAMAFHIEDYNEHFFANHGLEQLALLLKDPGAKFIDAEGLRLGAPVARPSKMVCVGANYADHAKEFGHDIPKEPILFSKATTAISGPNDSIMLPDGAQQVVDSEAELAVVIGRIASKVCAADALEHVAGYTVVNDVTERVVQKGNGQWFLGKGFDSFCPMGPFLVTPDEIDLGHLRVWQKLNGETLQEADTADMMFMVPFLIEYISRGMTLLPGDVISTGTPSGIGSARDPQVLMKVGDEVEVGVDGVGAQRTEVL